MAGLPKPEELRYLNLEKADIKYAPQEDFKDKFFRKTKENPFVPLGLLMTTAALCMGLYTLKSGNSALSQKMMRLRVSAQGFTVLAVLGGVMWTAQKAKTQPKE